MDQLTEGVTRAFWPLIWAHEYCHFWAARRLGLLARIEGARTYVHRPNRKQHVLIAIAPTFPSALLVLLALIAYLQLAVTQGSRIYYGSFLAIAVLILLSCAGDWWSILRSFFDPEALKVDSSAILIVSATPHQEQRAVQQQVEQLGYFVGWASTAERALASAGRNSYDLVVLDRVLPEAGRLALRQGLDARPESGTVPIFQLNSHGELARLPAYLQSGIPEGRTLG